MNLSLLIKQSIAVSAIVLSISCSTNMKPVAMNKDANPKTELDTLKSDRLRSVGLQTHLFAPYNFEKSEKYYEKALNESNENGDREDILKNIGYSKAYLAEADLIVTRNESKHKDLAEARIAAMNSGARQFPDELDKVDRRLMKYTEKVEKGANVDPKVSSEIQQEYVSLQISSIQADKLSEAKNNLKLARDQNALKHAPQSFALAEQQYNTAERLIETDRSNSVAIDQASIQATAASQKVLELLKNMENMKKNSPEQNAMNQEDQKTAILRADELTTLAIQNSARKDMRIQSQSSQIASQQNENSQLRNDEKFQASFEKARSQFNQNEADVYRQGNNLIIRLKSIEFASGRSDVPAQSFGTLNKVKNVIAQTNSQDILIEGHTDNVGSAKINQALSEKRAQSVAQFLGTSDDIEMEQIKSVGYGFDKPITSNKNNKGRAQNRRVDIVITPDKTAL